MPAKSSAKRREARTRAAKRVAIEKYMRARGELPVPGSKLGLLTICAELRNRIYEDVLLNKFRIDIHDCDALLAEKWNDLLTGVDGMLWSCPVELIFTGRRHHWENLMQWCKLLYHNPPTQVSYYKRVRLMLKTTTTPDYVPVAMGRVVLEGKFNDWETCERVLRSLHTMAGAVHVGWTSTHDME
ncbi:unnamed protein product [Zymoseptoria tritici ST99CH_3D7]|uniref:Uncharacterized protein n=1 Tax=Zymoseptoria tritici (strain ST99CH_3D7) TaxID=1276538 RepID=A0A1X7RE89_ZYMT9|nr:unnamed protein product [Zymoseptoria tritici ST99CH_3D7]